MEAIVRLKSEAPGTMVIDEDDSEQAEIERTERVLETKAQSVFCRRALY